MTRDIEHGMVASVSADPPGNIKAELTVNTAFAQQNRHELPRLDVHASTAFTPQRRQELLAADRARRAAAVVGMKGESYLVSLFFK